MLDAVADVGGVGDCEEEVCVGDTEVEGGWGW